jgi:hypothetical protein
MLVFQTTCLSVQHSPTDMVNEMSLVSQVWWGGFKMHCTQCECLAELNRTKHNILKLHKINHDQQSPVLLSVLRVTDSFVITE